MLDSIGCPLYRRQDFTLGLSEESPGVGAASLDKGPQRRYSVAFACAETAISRLNIAIESESTIAPLV